MDRLTKRLDGGLCEVIPGYSWHQVKYRLAAYEDTGLEPEEIENQLENFSEFLCEMTGGLLSKTNYSAGAMISAANDYQERLCAECERIERGSDINVATKWISVKDRLPEVKTPVMCRDDSGEYHIAVDWLDWPNGTVTFLVPDLQKWIKTTHWMPLPEPPSGF